MYLLGIRTYYKCLGKMVLPKVSIGPRCRLGRLGMKSGSTCNSSFVLTQTLGGSSSDLNNWVPVICMGDLSGCPRPSFNLTQLQLLQASEG